ncbi:DUF1189 family protein [Candidatus Woesearchaeota archaeon]|nr:DUF1189 family protein [Candidatus Woesearchaeota archaeon]
MVLPEFVKELIWTFYPPRYKELSELHLHRSLGFMSKILFLVFILTGILFLPKVFMLRGTIESELSKFDVFSVSGNVSQSDRVNVPRSNPWVVVDLNKDLNLSKELFVIDKDDIQYRFFGIKRIPREQVRELSNNRAAASRFLAIMLLLMLPGVALLLYLRAWLKYFLMVLVFGTFFFIVLDLTKYRLRWKQMLNVAAHAVAPIILIETISAFATTAYLVPLKLRFVGLSFYAVTLVLFAIVMVVAVVGCQVVEHKKKR